MRPITVLLEGLLFALFGADMHFKDKVGCNCNAGYDWEGDWYCRKCGALSPYETGESEGTDVPKD